MRPNDHQNEGDGPIPVGQHVCRVTLCDLTQSKAGNPQYKVELEVAAGTHEGRKLWDYFALTPKALWKLGRFLVACGFDGDSEIDENDEQAVWQVVGDELVTVTVRHEEYQGKQQAKPDSYSPAQKSKAKPLPKPPEAAAVTDPDQVPF